MVALNRDKVKRVIVSVDWGYVNPGVMQVWAIDGDNRMYLVHEVYFTKKLIDWWVNQAKMIQDHFKPEVFVCDPAEPAFIKQLHQAGCSTISAKNEVSPGIQAVQQRLARGYDDMPSLFIYRDALVERDSSLVDGHKPIGLAQEMPSYVWRAAPDGRPNKEEPEKLNDHACDTVRYAVMYLDGRAKLPANLDLGGLTKESKWAR